MRAEVTAAVVAAALLAGGAGGYALGSRGDAPKPAASPSPTAPSTAPDGPSDDDRRPMSEGPVDVCDSELATQRDLDECAARDLREAEALLARVLPAVLASVDGADRAALERSQRDWRAATDTLCGALGDDGGTIAGMNVVGCTADKVRDRAADLCVWVSPNTDDGLPEACRDLRP
jgi:uncharacterized protein YecT (DUF1311 family)